MARFEVVPTALSTESRRLALHSPTVAQIAGSLHAAGATRPRLPGTPQPTTRSRHSAGGHALHAGGVDCLRHDVTVYHGKVAGGTGRQTVIPEDIPHEHLDELLHLMHERKLA